MGTCEIWKPIINIVPQKAFRHLSLWNYEFHCIKYKISNTWNQQVNDYDQCMFNDLCTLQKFIFNSQLIYNVLSLTIKYMNIKYKMMKNSSILQLGIDHMWLEFNYIKDFFNLFGIKNKKRHWPIIFHTCSKNKPGG